VLAGFKAIQGVTIGSILLCFFFSLSYPLVTVLIALNLSESYPPSPYIGSLFPVLLSLAGFVIFGIIYIFLVHLPACGFSVGRFMAALAAVIGTTILSSVFIHRDYFTAVFQEVLIFWILFIPRAYDFFGGGRRGKEAAENLYRFSRFIFMAGIFWVMLMGYAISTRKEPRWIESVLYNVYNLGLLFLIIPASLKLRQRLYRTVTVSPLSIVIDGYDFTQFLGRTGSEILMRLLAARERSVLCSDLSGALSSGEGEHSGGSVSASQCEECMRNNSKVSLCSAYKTLYNRLRDIKNLLETLEVGTIIAPENKMHILREGWKLRLFSDIRVIFVEETSPVPSYEQSEKPVEP
jgi:hypothetical protein